MLKAWFYQWPTARLPETGKSLSTNTASGQTYLNFGTILHTFNNDKTDTPPSFTVSKNSGDHNAQLGGRTAGSADLTLP